MLWGRTQACSVLVAALLVIALEILAIALSGNRLRLPSPVKTTDFRQEEVIKTLNTTSKNSSKISLKTILLWTPYFKSYEYYKTIFSRITRKECPSSACRITRKRNQLKNADVVVFHLLNFQNSTPLPKHRPTNQPWLVFSFEAPPAIMTKQVDFQRLSGLVNWTMSYRLDSDVVVPYGTVVKRDEPDFQFADRDFWSENKNKMAVWMASHCDTQSHREEFISELQKYLQVDIFGDCGTKSCGRSLVMSNHVKRNDHECDRIVEGYFFYLAFENALCKRV